MRRSDVIFCLGLLALAVGLSPAVSFDGTRTPKGHPWLCRCPARRRPRSNRESMRRRLRLSQSRP